MIKQQLDDTFEKLVEEGAINTKKAVKSAAQQVASTVSAKKMWEQLLGTSATNESNNSHQSHESLKSAKSHTPLNLDKLSAKYQTQEKQQEIALKNRLFQLVKQGEEKVIQEKEQEKLQKKRREEYDKDFKKKKEIDAKNQGGDIPLGIQRKSIFSHKKVAKQQHAEYKPSTGKQ